MFNRRVSATRPQKKRTLRGWLLTTLLSLLVAEAALRVLVLYFGPHRDFRYVFAPDARVGWRLRPNVSRRVDVQRPPLHFTWDVGAGGMRGPGTLSPRRAGELRVLLLGDSFAFGLGVESRETFATLLQAQLRAELGREVTVFNTGTPSYGTVQEVALYEADQARFDPDLVVLAFYTNDLADNLTDFLFVDGELFEAPTLLWNHPVFLLELGHAVSRRLRRRTPEERSAELRRQHQALREHVLRLAARVRGNGQRFVFLNLAPRDETRFRLRNEHSAQHAPLSFEGVEVLDTWSLLEQQPETPYLEEHHFNPLGHRVVAQFLARELTARGLLSPAHP